MPKETITDRTTAASGIASSLFKYAATYGIDAGPICDSLDIDPSTFQDMVGRISLDRICRLMEACSVIAKDEAFGLKYTSTFVKGSTGPFGYGLMVAPTVRHFLQFHVDHLNYISQTSFCNLKHEAHFSELAWTYSPLIMKRDQYVDMGTALSMLHLRSIVGAAIDQVTVNLERPKPQNIQAFREHLTKRVTFANRINSLRVPASLLDMPNPAGDENLFRLMDIQCRSFHQDVAPAMDFMEQVREFITARVADENLSLSEMAQYFGISERTLQRRLSTWDSSLNAIRDDIRKSLAEKMLTETDLSGAEISFRLGYSAPSTFTRSVLRWFGETPKRVRKSAGGASDLD